ncbi:hypothetical protein BEP19_08320 [Ammoniphilus oxalaticus]|uniref:UmuC domain-containing protein n=1 Tax=Ammoniphilus oxalaticus TaxID=66863 RepID=A0A419SKF7_9BACL|nr:DNA polymerase IV [Ammoniphilus oxalaticus]RKD24388.1 hypothetical protein BEP19_08320 [Ammoniphilus oxalaticus]
MFDYSQMPNRSILMIDAKSFYASAHCALLGLDPLTTYLAVVGDPERSGSIVLAASPALKRDFGVKNVSRFFELPRDPRIQIVKAKMGKYLEVSVEITKILGRFAPFDSILQYSVDEAWIDITGTEKLFGDKWNVASKIKQTVWEELRIPLAIGIGPNMLIAKLCLDLGAKKTAEGIAEWTYQDLPAELWPRPVKEMWGIGSRMERNLHRLGIRSVGHLAQFERDRLEKRFGIMGVQLYNHAWGIDFSCVRPTANQPHKSYGNGITLLRDYSKVSEIQVVIRELADEVTSRARRDRMMGSTISLSIGYSKEEAGGFTRSLTLPTPTYLEDEVYKTCLQLFEQNHVPGNNARNVYVSLSNLCSDQYAQLELFDFEKREQKHRLAFTIDKIRDAFGSTSIMKASSLLEEGIAIDRSKKIGGHFG